MARDQQSAGSCPKCNSGLMTCLYNYFAKDVRTIHSWEHRCADCGYRVTQAFRTDDPEFDSAINPAVCPFCSRPAA